MNLIAALQAGIPDAANGYAELYRRGTGTRATWYASFEGDGANSSGGNITLDANGKAEVYVDELVDLLVKDASGNTVASFTEGRSSPIEEVRSQSFTGSDYVTAASAAGNPTTLQAVLDLWKTNSGAPDWKVLLDATNQTLQDAISRVAGPPFFNVKATAYGAKGDGATDDTNAIQTAINAASTNGGIVVFPPGKYILTAVLTVPQGVSLWGMGPGGLASTGAVELSQATAVERVLDIQASGTFGWREIYGLRMVHSAASTTALVVTSGAHTRPTLFRMCRFGSTVDNGNLVADDAAGDGSLYFTHCTFSMGANGVGPATGSAIMCNTSTRPWVIRDCLFIVPSTYDVTATFNGIIECGLGIRIVSGCKFDMSAKAGGTASAIRRTAGQLIATDNYITDPAGGTAYMLNLSAVTESSTVFEDNNQTDPAGGGAALYTVSSFTGNATPDWKRFFLGSREKREAYINDNSAALQLNALEFGIIFLDRSDATAQTLTTNFVVPNGSFTIVTRNNTGGAGATITPSTASFRPNAATYAIAGAGNLDVRRFRGVDIVGTIRWLADSTPVNNI